MQKQHTRIPLNSIGLVEFEVCKKHGKVDEYENCLIYCKYLVEIISLYGYTMIELNHTNVYKNRMYLRFLHSKSRVLHLPLRSLEFAIYHKVNVHTHTYKWHRSVDTY